MPKQNLADFNNSVVTPLYQNTAYFFNNTASTFSYLQWLEQILNAVYGVNQTVGQGEEKAGPSFTGNILPG